MWWLCGLSKLCKLSRCLPVLLRDKILRMGALLLPTFGLSPGGLSHLCSYANVLPKENMIPFPKYQQLGSRGTLSVCVWPMASLWPTSGQESTWTCAPVMPSVGTLSIQTCWRSHWRCDALWAAWEACRHTLVISGDQNVLAFRIASLCNN